MSIQNIIDKAQQIEIDRRRVVAQSMSRSQRAKTSERTTAQPWKFKITPPGSLPWTDSRGFIETISLADRADEYEISLNNNSRMNYITEYQGDLTQTMLDDLNLSAVSTSTFTINGLPSATEVLNSRTYNLTACAFTTATNATYNHAVSTARNDFLITNSDYDANFYSIQSGDVLSLGTYITGGQTISAISRNFITINSVGYTRIIMSANANAISPYNTNITITDYFETLVTTSTVIFRRGDLIQPVNSRYPYAVTADVLRGSVNTVIVSLNRPVITSEGITLTSAGVSVGNDCTWKVLVAALPTYKLVANRQVQFTGDFELIEKVI